MAEPALAIVNAFEHPQWIAPLFRAYTDELVSRCPEFAGYLALQHYDQELENPARKYGQDGCCLLMALEDGQPVGCIGLRKLDDTRAELKRFYVQPERRNRKIGSLLYEKILEFAIAQGYRQILLDTLPELQEAYRFYLRQGWNSCERYNDSPLSSSIYLNLPL